VRTIIPGRVLNVPELLSPPDGAAGG